MLLKLNCIYCKEIITLTIMNTEKIGGVIGFAVLLSFFLPGAFFEMTDSRWTVIIIGLIFYIAGRLVSFLTVRKYSDSTDIAMLNLVSGIIYFFGFGVLFNVNIQADNSGIDYVLLWILFILSGLIFVGSTSNLAEKDSLKLLGWTTLIGSIIALLPFFGIYLLV
jgi:uncharacterized membrane protein